MLNLEDSVTLHIIRRAVDRAIAAAERIMREDADVTITFLPNPEAVRARPRADFQFVVQYRGPGGPAAGQVEVWRDQTGEGMKQALLACIVALRAKGAPESSAR